MKYDPSKHHRRSIRLKNYDYSQSGAYFVTICTQNKNCVLGDIIDGKMQLTEWGHIISKWWINIPNHFPQVDLDVWIIMPNHLHGITIINHPRLGEVPSPKHQSQKSNNTQTLSPKYSSTRLGSIVAYFKYQSTKEINTNHNTTGARFWQRNYYEHIIRNDNDLNRIRNYIQNNPKNWTTDRLYK